ncbi:MAG TPA: aminotransferase class III-fold pyridoxal phosphate-dependent enzyme, partial [Thermomicrobiales bacterium]|nr:aminotransferase class III-fold pyridoxal phosphate-dependent enzyme [Thermomicrobiales bacterium]
MATTAARPATQATSAIERRYRERTPRSAALHEAATASLPGGDTRSVAHYRPYPLAIDRGRGAVLTDVDGNEYLDFLNNYTSLIHGHAHPRIVAAVTAQVARGTAYAAATASQADLARLIRARVPAVAAVRFCNSGTEATMNAVRAARA